MKTRNKIAHVPHMIDRNIMFTLQNKFNLYFEQTSKHRFRNVNDMQYAFAYFYFIIHEKNWRYQIKHNRLDWAYINVSGNPSLVKGNLTELIDLKFKFLCINDGIDYEKKKQAKLLRRVLRKHLNFLFPNKSSLGREIQ